MLSEKKTSGHTPFCSNALTSVPGAPAPSLRTDSQPCVEKPLVEISAPLCVAVALLSTFPPEPPRSTTVLDPVGTGLTATGPAGAAPAGPPAGIANASP